MIKSSHRRRLISLVMRGCRALLSANRPVWAAAMQREVEAIEDADVALAFALGCLEASLKERIFAMDSAVRIVRWGSIAVMLTLALFGARGAWRATDIDPASAMIFATSATAFAAAAAWSLLRGPIALVQAASTMLVVYALALAFATSASVEAPWPNADLHRALAREGLILWGILLAAGIFAARKVDGSASRRA